MRHAVPSTQEGAGLRSPLAELRAERERVKVPEKARGQILCGTTGRHMLLL